MIERCTICGHAEHEEVQREVRGQTVTFLRCTKCGIEKEKEG